MFRSSFQDEDALVLDDVADLAVGVEKVAELPGPHRADLDAGGVAARAGALDAERALLHHPLQGAAGCPGEWVFGLTSAFGMDGSAQLKCRAPYGHAAMQYRHPMHQS